MTATTHTLTEILSQPAIWRDALELIDRRGPQIRAIWEERRFEQVILTGCGSTYYAALVGAALIQQTTGLPCRALSASELMLFPRREFAPQRPTLLITVSREGKTRETIEAARLFRVHGQGMTLAVTCTGESVLAQEADAVLTIDTAREVSRAQTRSFSSMTLTLQALALLFAGQDALEPLAALPAHLERLVARYTPLVAELGADLHVERFLFLGSGPLYGLACEAALKALETTLVPALAFHTLEYLHGPKYIVTERTLVAGLLTDELLPEERRAMDDAHQRGATCLWISDRPGDLPAAGERRFPIALETGLPIEARAILYLPLLQQIICRQSMARGLNPDLPGQRA